MGVLLILHVFFLSIPLASSSFSTCFTGMVLGMAADVFIISNILLSLRCRTRYIGGCLLPFVKVGVGGG